MPEFVPGLELSESFYRDVVKPILDVHYPGLAYAAALIGAGSEVLGYDTEQSTDHHWGPRVMLFVSKDTYETLKTPISETLSAKLPYTFRGYSTNFGEPDEIGVRLMQEIASGPVNHRVDIATVRSFFMAHLGFDPHDDIRPADWLTFSEHQLLCATRGKVFHDGSGELTEVREKVGYYPRDIWLYLLASQWEKVAQDEAFVGRCGDVGDALGSRLVATRLVRHLMRLCFLMERHYAPYAKWFGSAFSRLECAHVLSPVLAGVLSAHSWWERERHLSEAYRIVAEKHNALDITEPLETEVSQYHTRPYMVIHGDRFVAAIRRQIRDEAVRNLDPAIGSVNQFADASDALEDPKLGRKLKILYE
ncbi:MAG TPA: DUF4037 domain-containing protein [Chloroflexia bacterium]|nr:DUF4037 domain-containing protein [Chloroflexia bacterium]